jgi:hypothetical protein
MLLSVLSSVLSALSSVSPSSTLRKTSEEVVLRRRCASDGSGE